MQHLPEPEEQRWILDGLAGLIQKGGLAPFVAAPIVETDRRYFPEGYSPTLPSVDRLARRLMQYAGLGFGILTANARWRYRSGGEQQGSYAVTKWVTTATGYLPPQAFSFALAAQLVAREPAPHEWRRVLAALETNQRAFAESAIEELASGRNRLTSTLSLRDRAGWPPPVAPASVLRPLPPPPEFEEWGDTEEDTTWNAGHPVFRVRESHVVLSTVLPGLIFAIGGMVLTGVLWGSQSGFWAGAAGAAIGLRTGLKGRCDVCSDPGCKAKIPEAAATCPGCGGTVAGRIDHPDQRLEAEERLGLRG